MVNIDQVNALVALGETTKYGAVLQLYAQGQIADPNAEANPAAVGVGLAGAKSLLVEAGAESAGGAGSLRLWLYRGPKNVSGSGTPGMGWTCPTAGDLGAVDTVRGLSERFDVSGFTRAYVEVYDGTGAGLAVVYGVGTL